MRAISSFKLYENVPAFRSAAFEEIASKTQPPLAVGFVKTILRYAMTNGIFCEPSPGHVSHSGLSLLLLKGPLARAFVSNNADGVFPSTAAQCFYQYSILIDKDSVFFNNTIITYY